MKQTRRKPMMGVEGPSFFDFQQQKKAEQKPGSVPPKKKFLESIFGPSPEQPPAGGPRPISIPEGRLRPGFQHRGFGYVDPNQWFEVAGIWDFVQRTRSSGSGWPVFVVDVLTRPTYNVSQSAGEIAQLFGIPASSFQGLSLEDYWTQVIGPFFENLERGINSMKPFTIPGSIRFDMNPEGSLLLVYQDR
jgi:hypothetical protein